MVSGIGSQAVNMQQMQQMQAKAPNGEDMFARLSQDLGLSSDTKTITKDQLTEYINQLESSDSTEDKGKLGFLKQLAESFDQIAGDDGEVSAVDLTNNIEMLKPPEKPSGVDRSSSLGFSKEWQDPSEITKDQLEPPINLLI